MSCGPFPVLWGGRCVLTERILRIAHAFGAAPHGVRCVVGRTLCSQGAFSLNRQSLGHLLMADAVLWDVRCVLAKSIFKIYSRWGHVLDPGAVLWDGRCVLNGSFLKIASRWEHVLWSFRCVVGQALCTHREDF